MAAFVKGPPPDLSQRFKLKWKYAELQRKYTKALQVRSCPKPLRRSTVLTCGGDTQVRQDLTLEVSEKDAKVQRLQDEVNLVLDQIYDTDYKHLQPADDDLFSEDEPDESDGDESEEDESGSDEDEDEDEDDSPWAKAAEGEPNTNGTGNGVAITNGNSEGIGNGHKNGNGNGHGAENGRVRKERPQVSSPGEGEGEPALKRPRVEGVLPLDVVGSSGV
ncbi:hypothetical protein P7C70_g4522, partial [Phenoliferia sp. Uapishka_3]